MAFITFATRTNFNVNATRVKLEAIGARRARAVCEAVKPQALQFIAEEAAARTKPNYRGKGHRSQSLTDASSYGADVTRQANGARLNIHIMGGEDFKAKFFSVNFGRTGGALVLPHGNYKLKWVDPDGTKRGYWQTHQGDLAGRHFYEAGLERAQALIASML